MIQLTFRKIATAVRQAPSVMKNATVFVRVVIRIGRASLLEGWRQRTSEGRVWSRTGTWREIQEKAGPSEFRKVRYPRQFDWLIARDEGVLFERSRCDNHRCRRRWRDMLFANRFRRELVGIE